MESKPLEAMHASKYDYTKKFGKITAAKREGIRRSAQTSEEARQDLACCSIKTQRLRPAAINGAHPKRPSQRFDSHGLIWIRVNDPSAGSPTETLLRLLLPLSDKVH